MVPWPIQDHRKDSNPPMVLCQSPQCTRVGQLATNPKVMDETYRKHCSSMQETWSAKRKARAREHWNNVVYPQALYERATMFLARVLNAASVKWKTAN